jgi:hypothetical protein
VTRGAEDNLDSFQLHLFLNLTTGYAEALTQLICTPVPAAMCLILISYLLPITFPGFLSLFQRVSPRIHRGSRSRVRVVAKGIVSSLKTRFLRGVLIGGVSGGKPDHDPFPRDAMWLQSPVVHHRTASNIVFVNPYAQGMGRGGAAGCRVKSKQSAMSSALASR